MGAMAELKVHHTVGVSNATVNFGMESLSWEATGEIQLRFKHITPQRPGVEVFYSWCIFCLLVYFPFTHPDSLPKSLPLGDGYDVCLHPLLHLIFPMTPSDPSSLQLLCPPSRPNVASF